MSVVEFEALFRKNYERLYYHAYDIIHDEDQAKDVVSDVFANVWQLRENTDMSTVLSYHYTAVRTAAWTASSSPSATCRSWRTCCTRWKCLPMPTGKNTRPASPC